MQKRFTNVLLLIFAPFIMISCSSDPTAKIQGIYEVNKDSLRVTLEEQIDADNPFSAGILNMAIQNSVIEFRVKGDSMSGVVFLGGETTLVNSKIEVRNDSLILVNSKNEAYLVPTEKGLLYKINGADLTIVLDKTDKTELTPEVQNALNSQEK